MKESPVFEARPDTVAGVAMSKAELARAEGNKPTIERTEAARGPAFFVALSLQFGQAGNSGLV